MTAIILLEDSEHILIKGWRRKIVNTSGNPLHRDG